MRRLFLAIAAFVVVTGLTGILYWPLIWFLIWAVVGGVDLFRFFKSK